DFIKYKEPCHSSRRQGCYSECLGSSEQRSGEQFKGYMCSWYWGSLEQSLEYNVFQADECDAFDSDVDGAPTTQTMFMANLSSVDPVYDEAGPSYDSDILSEYVKDNAEPIVQNIVSSVPNDASIMIINEMHEQTAQCVSVKAHTKAKFELTEREQKIKEQLRIVIIDCNIKEEDLKKELHSVRMQLNSTINHNKSMVEEVTSLKNDFQQK
nr:hypothetical protein [Tanacetum cinerariifolium]